MEKKNKTDAEFTTVAYIFSTISFLLLLAVVGFKKIKLIQMRIQKFLYRCRRRHLCFMYAK